MVCAASLPIGRRPVSPARAFGDQAVLDFVHAGIEAGKVALRCQSSVVEEMFVDAVGQQGLEIRVPFGDQRAEKPARAGIGGAVERECGSAEESIGVRQPELEAGARLDRPGAAVLAFRVAVEPDKHEIDELGNIQAVLDGGVGAAVGAHRFPQLAIRRFRGSRGEVIAEVVVSKDSHVILRLAAEVIREERIVEPLVGVVLSPIGSVHIEMHISSVGIEAAHLQHRVLHEAIGHVEATVHHVVIAGR